MVILSALPDDDPLRVEVRAAEESAAQKAKPTLIRDRQAAYQARNQRAREVAGD